jgi:hypothetical protein
MVQNDILMNKACTTTELLVSTVLKAKKTTVFLNFIFPRRRTVQEGTPHKKKDIYLCEGCVRATFVT